MKAEVKTVEGVDLKEDRHLPYFEISLCHYQLKENGPWYVGFVVNNGDIILTRNGKVLTEDHVYDYKLDDEEFHINLGPLVSAEEDQLICMYGPNYPISVCKEDPEQCMQFAKDLKKQE